jgi:glycerophosphoryl diester phosphodiesterase
MILLAFSLLTHSALADIEVHGHRGASAVQPENTIPALLHALKAGVDVLEFDLGISKEGVLVLSHDPRLSPVICQGPQGENPPADLLIRALTVAELKKWDCGTRKNPRFPQQMPVPGTAIPTLDEALAAIQSSKLPQAKTVRFNIETKIEPEHPDWTVGPEEFAAKVVEALKKHGILGRTILQSFDPRTLLAARKLEPKITLSYLTETEGEDWVATAKKLGVQWVSPYLASVNEVNVRAAHQAGLKVVPWTANFPQEWEALVSAKVDAIITDDPEALIRFLKTNPKRPPPHEH